MSKASTPAQRDARTRNWRIHQLRGYYANSYMIRNERGDQIRRLIDQELVAMDAEPEEVREIRRREALYSTPPPNVGQRKIGERIATKKHITDPKIPR